MKKKLFIFLGLLTLITLPLISKGPPRQKERRRKKNTSFFRFHVEQSMFNVKDDSSNNA